MINKYKFKKITLFSIIILFFVLSINIIFAQNNFNLELKIPETYKEIVPGQTIWVTTKILNRGNNERLDITLEYLVKDANNNNIFKKSETLAIEVQSSFVGEIKIPKNTPKGEYEITANLLLNEEIIASSKDSFKITPQKKQNNYIIYSIILVIIVIILFTIKPLFKKFNQFNHKQKLKRKINRIIKKRLYS